MAYVLMTKSTTAKLTSMAIASSTAYLPPKFERTHTVRAAGALQRGNVMHSRADIDENTIDPGDILLAARATCAVLISAQPRDALEIARAIALERGCGDRMLVHDFGAAPAAGLSEAPQSPLILLLRE